jgi:Zn-dependent protease
MGATTLPRQEAEIEAEIEQLRLAAEATGRPLDAAEQERVNALIVERAAAWRAWDAQQRGAFARERRAHWRGHERAKLRRAVRPSAIFIGLVGVMLGSGVWLCLSPSHAWVRPLTVAFILSGWIASVCVHEFGHALAAWLGGDDSVAERGYLNLDPRRYTNPLLSVALPVLFLLMGGLGLPGGAVLVQTSWLRSRRWELLVNAAGPLGTLLCLLLAAAPSLLGGERWISAGNVYFWAALAGLTQLLVISLILNLLPIPPLDGFNILSHWLPAGTRQQAAALGFMPLLLLYVVLGMPGPLADSFWHLADTLGSLLRQPDGYGAWAISQLSLRR